MLKKLNVIGSPEGLFTTWEDKYKGGTMSNYISSLNLLLAFLERPGRERFLKPWGSDKDISSLSRYFKALGLTYRGQKTGEEQLRHWENQDNVIDT